MSMGYPSVKKKEKKVLKLTVFQCMRCNTLNQIQSCFCGYPLFNVIEKTQKEYCEIFGHVSHSPILKTVEEGHAIKQVYECLGCGEEFKRDLPNPPTESIGCGNCKKDNSPPEDLHDSCIQY